MAKTLQMTFTTEQDKSVSLSIRDPREDLDEAAVRQAMQEIIANDVFTSASGSFVAIKAAKIIDRGVTDLIPTP